MTTSPNSYRGYRFPAELFEHAVSLHHCFSLSLHDVKIMLMARGVVVSSDGIRERGLRFSRLFANTLKRRRPRPGDKGFMDEVFVRVRGMLRHIGRAVDQHGDVPDDRAYGVTVECQATYVGLASPEVKPARCPVPPF